MKHLKTWLSLLLVLLMVLSAGVPAMAEKTISSAYIYYKDGLPKYWLDFTGAIAENPVLHCYFFTDSWYESLYILDFISAIPYSHQDTYRIETVYDAFGRDVSDWFRTVSLEIRDNSVRLYIERDPATLAGGSESTILDGSYEMTPAAAGVLYEFIEEKQLKNWLILNAENAELHFSDGKVWYLETESSGEYTADVIRITAQSGEKIPFRSLSVSYVQGALLLDADVNAEFSGVFLFNPRVFLQRSDCSAKELARMAQLYYYRHHNFYPPEADVEPNGDGTFTVHLYEIVDNGDGTFHTATSAWYTVDASGIGSDNIFGNSIDLQR